MIERHLVDLFQKLSESVQFASFRVHFNNYETTRLRNDVLEPVLMSQDHGYMINVVNQGGMGYAASSDFSSEGLAACFHQAKQWANLGAKNFVYDYSSIDYPNPKGTYSSEVSKTWDELPLKEKIEIITPVCKQLKTSDRIVMRDVGVNSHRSEVLYFTSQGGQVHQAFQRIMPSLMVTAGNGKGQFETRTFGRGNICWQGGLDVLEEEGFFQVAETIALEAEALLNAPICPEGKYDLLLAPDQMILQIHESIGHPLELDRILGDERNYAGTSFVTKEMFGNYQYGSPLLNITLDPKVRHEVASYAFDDEGSEAEKSYLIKDGILQNPLGGLTSQHRAGLKGVANTRACHWNRPAIDRMANLNLEPGTQNFAEILSGIERGVYMQTNSSWSIDDSRNKFQFGCEIAYLIEDGMLKTMLRRPNYRGISANFWRSLKAVGNAESVKIMGSPYCGKGEPNQAVYVGHSSPPCLFSQIDVFGGVQ